MKNFITTMLLTLIASGACHAYETGSLTCQKIGELAASTLAAKQSGMSYTASLSAFTEPFSVDAKVERHLVTNMVDILYHNELLVAMKPKDAHLVFMHDCMRGKGQGHDH